MRSLLAATFAAALFAALPAAADDSAPTCGTKRLYGHKLLIRVEGDPLPCDRVREIIRGRCKSGKTWSCFSFRPPAPALVWFREKERFQEDWSTAIEAERYPCSEARVTRRQWLSRNSWRFPTKQQMLADDLVRCGQLRGKTYKQIVRLLGKPHFTERRHGKPHFISWDIGAERDSYFQVDDESFDIELRRDGVFRRASYSQL
jgi:hypothetical protein